MNLVTSPHPGVPWQGVIEYDRSGVTGDHSPIGMPVYGHVLGCSANYPWPVVMLPAQCVVTHIGSSVFTCSLVPLAGGWCVDTV